MSTDTTTPVATDTVKGNILKLLGIQPGEKRTSKPVETTRTARPTIDQEQLRFEAVKFVDDIKSRVAEARDELSLLLADGKANDLTGLRRNMEDLTLAIERSYPSLQLPGGELSGKSIRGFRRSMERTDKQTTQLENLIVEVGEQYTGNIQKLNEKIAARETLRDQEIEGVKKTTSLESKKSEFGKLNIKNFGGQKENNITKSTLAFYEQKVLQQPANPKKEEDKKTKKFFTDNVAAIKKYLELQTAIAAAEKSIKEISDECQKEVDDLADERDQWKRPQKIEWQDAADIVYGTKLDATQLNAVLKIGNGALAYTAPDGSSASGAVPRAGAGQKLTVEAAETDQFRTEKKQVTINVLKAPREIVIANPTKTIVYGTGFKKADLKLAVTTTELTKHENEDLAKALDVVLSGQVLNDGKVLDVGTHDLTIQAKEHNNFDLPAPKTFSLVVQKATQVIAWKEQPTQLTYGDRLTLSELDARVTTNSALAGKADELTKTLQYFDSANQPVAVGKLLDVGAHTITVKTGNQPNFEAAEKKADFTIIKATRAIRVKPLKPIESTLTAGDIKQLETNIKLSAGTEKLEYLIGTTKLAVGVQVPVGVGKKIKVVAPKSPNYEDVADIEVDVEVTKRNPVIEWKEPKPIASGTALSDTQLNAVVKLGDKALVYAPKKGHVFAVPATEPINEFLRAVHPESDAFEQGVKSVRLTIAPNESGVKGYQKMRDGTALDKSLLTQDQKDLVDAWDTDKNNVRTETVELFNKLKELPGEKLKEFMNELVTDPSKRVDETKFNNPPDYPNMIWALPNGMQVRYKPKGDAFIPKEMFCIEGRTSPGCSGGPGDVAFKVSVDGAAAAKGPKQNLPPTGNVDTADYKKGTCYATHIQCIPLIEPYVEWKIPKDLVFGMKFSPDWVQLPREHGTLSWLAPTDPSGWLKVGNDQTAQIKLLETKKYKEHSPSTTFSVQPAKQVIACEKTLELTWGKPVQLAALNASVTTNPPEAANAEPNTLENLKAALTLTDDKGASVEGSLLDAKDGYILQIRAPETDNFQEAVEPITVRVKPAKQNIDCKETLELTWGTALKTAMFNAQVTTDPPEAATAVPNMLETLNQGLTIIDDQNASADGVVLDAKDGYRIRVHAPKSANFEEKYKEVTVNVKPAPRKVQWNAKDLIEIEAGKALASELFEADVTTEPPMPNLYDGLKKQLVYVDGNGKEIKPGDVLPLGETKLTVKTTENPNLTSAVGKTITIKVSEPG